MVLTDTVHPPAGATALVAATEAQVRELGWFLLPIVVLSVVLMTATGCIIGNVQRRWPLYWWRECPVDDGEATDGSGGGAEDALGQTDVEKGSQRKQGGGIDNGTARHMEVCTGVDGQRGRGGHVVIIPGKVLLSDGLELSDEDMEVLESLSQRLSF